MDILSLVSTIRIHFRVFFRIVFISQNRLDRRLQPLHKDKKNASLSRQPNKKKHVPTVTTSCASTRNKINIGVD